MQDASHALDSHGARRGARVNNETVGRDLNTRSAMGENSKIEWTHHTFNPWIGCAKVSAGCANCYAEALMDKQYGKVRWGPNGERKRTTYENWKKVKKWNRDAERAGERRRVFCASLADVFEDREHLDSWRADLFYLIDLCQSLDFLLLTKRPENIRRMYPHRWIESTPHNVWLGASVENQDAADLRIQHLLNVPAVIHFLSCEPLLGSVNLAKPYGHWHEESVQQGIDWVIVGGESGHHARPLYVEGVREIRDRCQESGVACFIKQLGKVAYDGCEQLKLTDKKGGDWNEWPEDLRVREFPTAKEPA